VIEVKRGHEGASTLRIGRQARRFFPTSLTQGATNFPSSLRRAGRKIQLHRDLPSPRRVVRDVQYRRTKHNHSPNKEQTSITMRLVRYTYPTFRTTAPAYGFQRSPWAGLETEIDRLFDTALSDFGGAASATFPVDLYEDKANTYVRAELPGVNRDDINVEMTDGTLTIAASRKTPATEGKAEESFSFNRAVSIATEIEADKVSAAYENGVLTVTLPKREVVLPKKVTVAVK
jgi:HSP20 family protein